MNQLQKSPQLSLWYMIPVALGLHGLVLWLPVDLKETAEKPQGAPVKMMPIKQPALQPSPVKLPIAAAPPPPTTPPAAPAVNPPPVADPRSPAPVLPQPAPTPAPVPSSSPVPTPSPDVFQIQGAIACDGIKDCYTSAETNGRSVAHTLEQQLEAQGYTLKPLDLDDETGMKVYQLFQKGQPQDYLHIIWTNQGTRSLRLPQPVTDQQRLAALVRF